MEIIWGLILQWGLPVHFLWRACLAFSVTRAVEASWAFLKPKVQVVTLLGFGGEVLGMCPCGEPRPVLGCQNILSQTPVGMLIPKALLIFPAVC